MLYMGLGYGKIFCFLEVRGEDILCQDLEINEIYYEMVEN